MAGDPNGPYNWRNGDGNNDILRKILNWFAALGAGTKTIAVSIADAVAFTISGIVSGTGYTASDSVTRANTVTGYTAGDVISTAVGENLEFAGIGPESMTAIAPKVIITQAKLRIDAASIPSGMTYFRLHLWNTNPTAIADNDPFNLIAADREGYQGFIEFPIPLDLGDTLYVETEAMNYATRKEVDLTLTGNLYGQLQTVGSYTPVANTVYNVELKAVSV